MILILSQEKWEMTTEEVQDWIESLGGQWVRLNGDDLNLSGRLALSIGEDGESLQITIDGRTIDLDQIGVVWMRRWYGHRHLTVLGHVHDAEVAQGIRRHLLGEMRSLNDSLGVMIGHLPALSTLRQRRVNKWESLLLAKKSGLTVPATLITNNKQDLEAFVARYGRIITKSIAEAATLSHHDRDYSMYTVEVRDHHIALAPDQFFPSLVQEYLDKDFEVRTFYLAGECYSMAIFSQGDEQTALDFRRYNDRHPNRLVPYRLSAGLEDCVRAFMNESGLKTGSLDFVRTPDGRLVFLEVNPAGQFRMISDPCNYRLEKRVAEYLVKEDRDARRKA